MKMSRALAAKTVDRYVCSNCWGHLVETFGKDPSVSDVTCPVCGDDLKGFVSKYYAERRREESVGELMDVKHMLRQLGIVKNPHEGKSSGDILSELGF